MRKILLAFVPVIFVPLSPMFRSSAIFNPISMQKNSVQILAMRGFCDKKGPIHIHGEWRDQLRKKYGEKGLKEIDEAAEQISEFSMQQLLEKASKIKKRNMVCRTRSEN